MDKYRDLIERILVLVPDNNTDDIVKTQAYLAREGNLIGCQQLTSHMEAKERMMDSLYQLIGRIVIHEIGEYLYSAILESKAEACIANAFQDRQIASSLGIEPMRPGDQAQFDLFQERVWTLSKDRNYERAHKAVQLICSHVKDRQRLHVDGKVEGTYLTDMDYLLQMFSPGHKVIRSGAMIFPESALHYSLTDHGFPFSNDSMNVEDSIIFHPIIVYFKMQSVMLPYAAEHLDSVSKLYLNFSPDQLTHHSGKPVPEVLRGNQLFREYPF